MFHSSKILPFYMTYPLPLFYEEEDAVMRDLEYLQETYPKEARKYQQKVARLLDRFDYDGSVIYDDFPDRLALYKIVQDIMAVIEQEEKEAEQEIAPERLPVIMEIVHILLCNEIYKRRRMKGNGVIRF